MLTPPLPRLLLACVLALQLQVAGCAMDEEPQALEAGQAASAFPPAAAESAAPTSEPSPDPADVADTEAETEPEPEVETETAGEAELARAEAPASAPPAVAGTQRVRLAAARPEPGAGRRVSLNTHTKKYHEPGCRHYACRSCEEVSLGAAQAAGGVPCRRCH